jgi:hypothetical protein
VDCFVRMNQIAGDLLTLDPAGREREWDRRFVPVFDRE